ncbi:DUF6397 family protein [Streptomyces sp. NPDC048590]|uniref:DUF6397 family protein n=1 Tax=Streptomyces sp. NPDC048590 TaxID=3365574 RepID=UPI00371391D2
MNVSEASRVGCSGTSAREWVSAGRAAAELALKHEEVDLAVHLGLIDAGPVVGAARPPVHRSEIDRLRAQPGFPEQLKERVRTVGTAEGASLLRTDAARFTALARAGYLPPVAFHLNRRRTVVWLHLAEELRDFAAREPDLPTGWMTRRTRTRGTDLRARNWRSRRIQRLLGRAADPWVRASLQASALAAVQLAEVVEDPYERAHLARVRPRALIGRPGTVAGREAEARMMLAEDPDETHWRRANLTQELDRARAAGPAPRPGGLPAARPPRTHGLAVGPALCGPSPRAARARPPAGRVRGEESWQAGAADACPPGQVNELTGVARRDILTTC